MCCGCRMPRCDFALRRSCSQLERGRAVMNGGWSGKGRGGGEGPGDFGKSSRARPEHQDALGAR